MATRRGVKRPDLILRNKSKKQKDAVSKSWANKKIRESRVNKLKEHKGVKKATYGHKGHKHTQETRGKISKNRRFKSIGKSHHAWLGDFPSYSAVHHWVKKYKGCPFMCNNCLKIREKSNTHHWANIDHKYKRDLNDYISLCAKCHRKYDTFQLP